MMRLETGTLALILVMALAAVVCRFAGFAFMRFIPMTPRVKAALGAMPLAVMLALVLPPALRGGVPEAVGIAATIAAVVLRGNEVVAVVAGMGTVAMARAFGL
jgi:uncharacterized membrane protein